MQCGIKMKSKEEQEEYEYQQAQCKHLIDSAKTRPDLWKIRTVHEGQKHFIQEVSDDKLLWIVDEFKGKYRLDFMMKESIDAIRELTSGGCAEPTDPRRSCSPK
jgi:hypothetical protein